MNHNLRYILQIVINIFEICCHMIYIIWLLVTYCPIYLMVFPLHWVLLEVINSLESTSRNYTLLMNFFGIFPYFGKLLTNMAYLSRFLYKYITLYQCNILVNQCNFSYKYWATVRGPPFSPLTILFLQACYSHYHFLFFFWNPFITVFIAFQTLSASIYTHFFYSTDF